MTDEQKDETVEVEEESPIFDWDNISVDEYFDFMDKSRQYVELQVLLEQSVKKDATDKEIASYEKKQAKAVVDASIVLVAMRDIMARTLLAVPRSWLVSNAPENIERDKLIGLMKRSKYKMLPQVYQGGASEEPKN